MKKVPKPAAKKAAKKAAAKKAAVKKPAAKKAAVKKVAAKKAVPKKVTAKKAAATKVAVAPPQVAAGPLAGGPVPGLAAAAPAPNLVPTMPAGGTHVLVWEDDPESEGAVPVAIPVPGNPQAQFQINIIGEAPPPALYQPGTREFRYWTARAALVRCRDFWAELVPPGAAWQTGGAQLPVTLEAAGVQINAYYNRLNGLGFHHDTVDGKEIFTADSADIVCHELGHAVLDAVQPSLGVSNTFETAAFHEAFGDISALLSGLQLPSFCQHLLGRHGNMIERDSRWTRIGEAMGKALHQRNPAQASPFCLRNAANSFYYQPPKDLPASGPDIQLTREPHSLARTFVGGFLQAFAELARHDAVVLTGESLQQSAAKAGALLVLAVRQAPVQTDYFYQVASALVSRSAALGETGARNAFASAFVRRGILPVEAMANGWPDQPGTLDANTGIKTPGPMPVAAAAGPPPGHPGPMFGAAGVPMAMPGPGPQFGAAAAPQPAPSLVFDGKRFGLKGNLALRLPSKIDHVVLNVAKAFFRGVHRSAASSSTGGDLVQVLSNAFLSGLESAIVAAPQPAAEVSFGAAPPTPVAAAAAVPTPAAAGPQDLVHEEAFVHYLFQRGRVEFTSDTLPMAASGPIQARKTHRLSMLNGEPTLERIGFDCGFD